MSLHLENLDTITRQKMLEEIRLDLSNAELYISNRLSATGRKDYPSLLQEAVGHFDDSWLANELGKHGRLNHTETRKTKSGTTVVRVPVSAASTLAEGEFNRFYIRALCSRAADEKCNLEICRVKEVSQPRLESEKKIGTFVDPGLLLKDLRANVGVDTALGVPAGPNSGLSVRLKQQNSVH